MRDGDVHSVLDRLDPEQRAVAQAVRGPVCVHAGAGTGKTRAITYRIAHAVQSGIVEPQHVLAVTFTARAAGEMRSRLRDLGVSGVQARTFHSAALSQMRYFWPYAIGGHVPEIRESKAAFVSAAAAQLGMPNDVPSVRDMAAEIEWAKVSLISAEDYPLRARQAGRVNVADQNPEDIGRLIETYEAIKTERGVIDFEDTILILIGIMLDRPDIARMIREQYRYFVVDEYQDVSPMQHRLLQLWIGGRSDVCVVGDAAQTIYSFAGARAQYLENFTQEFRSSQSITLNRNYRSTPEIIELANAVVSTETGVQPVQLRAMRASGQSVQFHAYHHGSREADDIASRIAVLHSSGIPLSDIAILYRTNSQSAEFERALGQAGIAYQMQGEESFFKRREVREAMVVLRAEARTQASSIDSLPGDVESVLRTMGWRPEGPRARGASRERWESLDALRILSEEMWEKRRASMREFVAELEERAELHNIPQTNAVTLSSLHAAKGLEWEVVFLAGLTEGLLPISYANTQEEVEEEKRLLYVGITRARTQLHLSYAHTYGSRSARELSRFLQPLWPREQSRSTQARQRAARATAQFHADDPIAYALFERLAEWRASIARESGKPAYAIFHDATLREIARAQPRTLAQLSQIRGVGTLKLSTYGPAIVEVISAHSLSCSASNGA